METVNHPKHYNEGSIEVIDILKDQMSGEAYCGFLLGNILKYLLRAGHKTESPIEDYKKAQWYLTELIGVSNSNK